MADHIYWTKGTPNINDSNFQDGDAVLVRRKLSTVEIRAVKKLNLKAWFIYVFDKNAFCECDENWMANVSWYATVKNEFSNHGVKFVGDD